MTSLNVWLLCLINFFINVGWIFLATKLATYLQECTPCRVKATGWLTAGTALAGMIGCVTGGWITDRLVRKLGLRGPPRFRASVPVAERQRPIWSAYAGQHSTVIVIASAACAYFLSDLVGTVWATYQDIGSRSVGVVLGFGNMCGNLGAWYFSKPDRQSGRQGNCSEDDADRRWQLWRAMICRLFVDPARADRVFVGQGRPRIAWPRPGIPSRRATPLPFSCQR